MTTKVWHISDTHTRHDELSIPENIDLVIHSGDESNSRHSAINANECSDFLDWYSKLPIINKVFVAGNHSTAIYRGLISKDFIRSLGIVYLENQSVTIHGINIYGSPYTPTYGKDCAFMRKRGRLGDVWDMIPKETDVLVTHGPPKGKLDLTKCRHAKEIVMGGCKELLNKINTLNISHCMFGHFHNEENIDNYGMLYQNDVTFYNSSCCSFKDKDNLNQGHTFYI